MILWITIVSLLFSHVENIFPIVIIFFLFWEFFSCCKNISSAARIFLLLQKFSFSQETFLFFWEFFCCFKNFSPLWKYFSCCENFLLAVKILPPSWEFFYSSEIFVIERHFTSKSCNIWYARLFRLCLVLQPRSHQSKR